MFLQNDVRVKTHFHTCFLALIIYRYLEQQIDDKYTCDDILNTLKKMNFAGIKEQGFIPTYQRTKRTDNLHEACGFCTDYEFITKSQMRTIQKKAKEDRNYYTAKRRKSLAIALSIRDVRLFFFPTVKDRDYKIIAILCQGEKNPRHHSAAGGKLSYDQYSILSPTCSYNHLENSTGR